MNADTEIICVGFDYRMDVLHYLGWYRRSFRSLIWGDEESAVFYIIDNYIFIKLYEKFPAEKVTPRK